MEFLGLQEQFEAAIRFTIRAVVVGAALVGLGVLIGHYWR